jgi:type III secretion protein Q
MRPFRLPTLTASEAQALSTVAHSGKKITLSAWKWGAPPTLALNVVPAGHPIDADNLQRLELDWAGAKLTLDVPRTAVHSWVSEVLGGADVAALPPEWQQAAWFQACEWLAHTLTQAGRGKARIQQLGAAAGAHPISVRHRFLCSLHFSAKHGQPELVMHAILHTDSLGVLLLSGFVASHGQAIAPQSTPALPITLQLALGESDVPLQQLQQVRPGDVVFFSRSWVAQRQQLILVQGGDHAPRWAVSARLDGHSLHILQAPITMASPDSTAHPEDSEQPAEPVSLTQIPIRLGFDLGSLTVPLESLQSMQAGQVLNLERPTQDYVTIRANGAVVGQGQLVEIDGRLGVMVSALSVAQGSQP